MEEGSCSSGTVRAGRPANVFSVRSSGEQQHRQASSGQQQFGRQNSSGSGSGGDACHSSLRSSLQSSGEQHSVTATDNSVLHRLLQQQQQHDQQQRQLRLHQQQQQQMQHLRPPVAPVVIDVDLESDDNMQQQHQHKLSSSVAHGTSSSSRPRVVQANNWTQNSAAPPLQQKQQKQQQQQHHDPMQEPDPYALHRPPSSFTAKKADDAVAAGPRQRVLPASLFMKKPSMEKSKKPFNKRERASDKSDKSKVRNDEPVSKQARKEALDAMKQRLSEEQAAVIDAVEQGKNVFFTGSAGVGKSHTLCVLIDMLKQRYGIGVHVTASTGIAATHIGGTTLHSFAGVGIGVGSPEELLAKAKKNSTSRDRWQEARVLVIDEVSMVSADFFTALDYIAKGIRKNTRPFGGIQVVLSGDFLQLPPVEKGPAKFVFESKAWQDLVDVSIELTRVFRQTDSRFVTMLQDIRMGIVTDAHDAVLRSRINATLDCNNGIQPTRLYTHRGDVDSENQAKLKLLPGAEVSYTAIDTGDQYARETLQKGCLAPDSLKLKIGAQVMLLKNLDPPMLVNGSRGVVISFDKIGKPQLQELVRNRSYIPPDIENQIFPVVAFDGGTTQLITPATWDLERAGAVAASRIQVPLCLAWAITVHKCQGMTVDKIEVDISSAWDDGQAFVALSRSRTIEGLSLLGYRRDKIRANAKVKEFYRTIRYGEARDNSFFKE